VQTVENKTENIFFSKTPFPAIEMLRARYQQGQIRPAPSVENQSRSDTKNDAELASILSAPSPGAAQTTIKEGRTTPSLRSSYLRSSSAVSMESGRSVNSSPSLEGAGGLQSIFDNNNSDNDADYSMVFELFSLFSIWSFFTFF